MRGRIYASRRDADAAQRVENERAGVPRVHEEGGGPADFSIQYPGAAAERTRARGVRTDRVYDLVPNRDGTAFALLVDDGDELDADRWFEPPPR